MPTPSQPLLTNATPSPIPEKQSIREAILHLFARYREMRPLFLAAARPMKVEWKMSPYFGVLPLVFRALGEEYSVESLQSEMSTLLAKAAPPCPFPSTSRVSLRLGWVYPTSCQPIAPKVERRHPTSLTWKLGPFAGPWESLRHQDRPSPP